MGEVKHTPGEWVVEKFGPYQDCEDYVGARVVSEDGQVVAEVRGAIFVPGYGELPENEANARLIAAAPELLQALQWLMPENLGEISSNIPNSAVVPLDVTVEELRAARAAIAKAVRS